MVNPLKVGCLSKFTHVPPFLPLLKAFITLSTWNHQQLLHFTVFNCFHITYLLPFLKILISNNIKRSQGHTSNELHTLITNYDTI